MYMEKNKQKIEPLINNFKIKLESTNTLPQYMKEVYLEKLSSKNFSSYWVKKITQIIKKLEVYIK